MQIYLLNFGVDYVDYVDGFKLIEMEFDMIRNFVFDSCCFLVKQGDCSMVCNLNLYGFVDELEIFIGIFESVELCEQVCQEFCIDDLDVWVLVFLECLKFQK